MNPINTALLSYGMSGEIFHAPLLSADPGFALSMVVQRNSDKAKRRYPSVRIVKQVNDVMADESIELVVVNVPNEWHYQYATQALEAGKHVIVEKPFTVTVQEADNLMALAKKKNKLLTVFQNRRWDGDFLTVKKVIENGWVGKIAEFELHYDRYRNYIEANTWKEEQGPGSGILYNLGSHMLDQVLVLFGMPIEVDARVGVQRPGGKVEDFYDIRMQYRDFQAVVKSSYLVREATPRYMLHGTEGSFIKYGIDPQEQALKDGKIPGSPGWGVDPKELWGKLNTSLSGLHVEGLIETVPGNYSAFYRNVHDSIRKGDSLSVKPGESRDGIRLIEACYESSRSHKAIKI
ncbi:oxidoreductase [Chryseolinea sp. H1M3-3]|uniref:oxidoreductase n=1 Tax=Chryseolinea sp. H1M3-3 TaxID=3034144 RepID=UPI0023ECE62E|nr:oxidoreductase [Chryseolinea sp. H1M3-3]